MTRRTLRNGLFAVGTALTIGSTGAAAAGEAIEPSRITLAAPVKVADARVQLHVIRVAAHSLRVRVLHHQRHKRALRRAARMARLK